MSGFRRPAATQEIKYEGSAPGKDGRGVSQVYVNPDGELLVFFTDGSEVNAGRVMGPAGKDGADGASIKGDKGDKGDPGDRGQDGETIKGDKGDQGDKGDPGHSIKGDKGDPGADGLSVRGDKGDPGQSIRGERGLQGEKGDAGQSIQGEQGDKGEPGELGKDGKDGIDGKDGRDGIDLTAPQPKPKGRTLYGATIYGVPVRLTWDRREPGPTNTLNVPEHTAYLCRLTIFATGSAGQTMVALTGFLSRAESVEATTWRQIGRRVMDGEDWPVTVAADTVMGGLSVTVDGPPAEWVCRVDRLPE